jgi:hypothetical protein
MDHSRRRGGDHSRSGVGASCEEKKDVTQR